MCMHNGKKSRYILWSVRASLARSLSLLYSHCLYFSQFCTLSHSLVTMHLFAFDFIVCSIHSMYKIRAWFWVYGYVHVIHHSSSSRSTSRKSLTRKTTSERKREREQINVSCAQCCCIQYISFPRRPNPECSIAPVNDHIAVRLNVYFCVLTLQLNLFYSFSDSWYKTWWQSFAVYKCPYQRKKTVCRPTVFVCTQWNEGFTRIGFA